MGSLLSQSTSPRGQPQGACGGPGVGGRGPGGALSQGMRSKSTEVTAV